MNLKYIANGKIGSVTIQIDFVGLPSIIKEFKNDRATAQPLLEAYEPLSTNGEGTIICIKNLDTGEDIKHDKQIISFDNPFYKTQANQLAIWI